MCRAKDVVRDGIGPSAEMIAVVQHNSQRKDRPGAQQLLVASSILGPSHRTCGGARHPREPNAQTWSLGRWLSAVNGFAPVAVARTAEDLRTAALELGLGLSRGMKINMPEGAIAVPRCWGSIDACSDEFTVGPCDLI